MQKVEEEQLLELAKEDRFMPGIYNYCDRWGERCLQTQGCLNFALEKEDLPEGETQDINKE